MNDQDERDFLAITEKEIFEEARDRLKIAVDAESDDRSRAKIDLLFRDGDQWPADVQTSYSQESPKLTINLTDALVRQVINNIKQQRPRGKCHPVGDGAQIEIADIINGIGRHVENRSEVSIAYDTGADLAVTIGWGYWRLIDEFVAANSFDRDLRILPIRNSFTVYMDPSAIMPTACDANWCLITIKMKRTDYRMRYPKADNVSWSDVGNNESREDWESKEEIRLAEYFRIMEKADKLFLLRDRGGNETTRYKSQMPSSEYMEAAGLTIVGERPSSRKEVQWFKLNGTKVVDRKVKPGTYIPVIRCEGNVIDVDGQVRRRGMVRAMMDPQRMVNFGEVAKIKRLGLAPQAPWVVAEGQLDGHDEWVNANHQPVPVLTYKPITIQTDQGEIPLPPPQRQPPAQIEAGFAEFVQGMRTNLLAVAGMPHEPGADTQGTVVSGIAQQRRQQRSDQSHFQYYDNQTLAIAHTWRIMLEWIPEIYSGERMQRIIGEDSTPKMVKINEKVTEDGITTIKNDISVGRYDVVMDTGPGYETKREEGSETLISLLSIQPLAELIAKNGADLVFRSIDHPYMQELADRIAAMTPQGLEDIMEQLPERAKAVVKALSGQIQQLQQALQQAQIENKYGIAKEHMKAVVKAHDVEESNKTKRMDTQVRADTAQFDTLIKAHTQLADKELSIGGEMLVHHHDKIGEALLGKGKENGSSSTGQQ